MRGIERAWGRGSEGEGKRGHRSHRIVFAIGPAIGAVTFHEPRAPFAHILLAIRPDIHTSRSLGIPPAVACNAALWHFAVIKITNILVRGVVWHIVPRVFCVLAVHPAVFKRSLVDLP
jgi:hypothetical protein